MTVVPHQTYLDAVRPSPVADGEIISAIWVLRRALRCGSPAQIFALGRELLYLRRIARSEFGRVAS